MQKDHKQLFPVIQLLNSFSVIGKKRLNLDSNCRLVLIAIAHYTFKNGKSYVLKSQIEDMTGICVRTITNCLRSLEKLKFILIKRMYNKEKKMTKNVYTINLNIILSLDMNNDSVEVDLNKSSIDIEPSAPHAGRSNIEPSACGAPIKPNEIKQDQKRNLLDIVRLPSDALSQTPDPSPVVAFTHDHYFEEFWATYPRKEKKKEAREIWIRNKLDKIAQMIIDDVRLRQTLHTPWGERSFIPIPTSYLNGERWNDEIINPQATGATNGKSSKQQGSYIDQLNKAGEIIRNNPEAFPSFQTNLGAKMDKKY